MQKTVYPSSWVLLGVLVGFGGFSVWPRSPKTPTLCPARACEIPIELADGSVRCLSAEQAAHLRVSQGDQPPFSQDGSRLAGPPARMSPKRLLALGVRLDPNRATKEEWEALPDIGPSLAEAILAERSRAPFQTLSDLRRVHGLGPTRLSKLIPYLDELQLQLPH